MPGAIVTMAVLGHSWGGLLGMEYAISYPRKVSHMILMNTAPASHGDQELFREERGKREAGNLEKLKALRATAQYEAGDLETEAKYYRVHFQATLRNPEQLERLVRSLRSSFTPESVRKARAIEDRLYDETWLASQYDLLPKLRRLHLPTLILHGENDIFPVTCAEHIAQAIPEARLVVLPGCGHFSYFECPDEVEKLVIDFFH